MSGPREKLQALLHLEHVTAPTREVLEARLHDRFQRSYFREDEFRVLQAASARLVPHDPTQMDLTGCVDDRLANGRTDGWHYADTPPDGEALRALLGALPADFMDLGGEEQDTHLRGVKQQFPHVFEDLLAELTETYYSHPVVQVSIGYVGFADAPRWNLIELNELEPRERAVPTPEVGLDADF